MPDLQKVDSHNLKTTIHLCQVKQTMSFDQMKDDIGISILFTKIHKYRARAMLWSIIFSNGVDVFERSIYLFYNNICSFKNSLL